MLIIEVRNEREKGLCDMEVFEDGQWIESSSNAPIEDITRARRRYLTKHLRGEK
jgi:hypothetical protein